MARTATRLAGPALLTAAAATKYTVPGSTVAIIRSVRVYNPSSVDRKFTMSIGADAAGTRLFDHFVVTANSILQHWCYEVLAAAEVIQAYSDVASILVFTINGDQVT